MARYSRGTLVTPHLAPLRSTLPTAVGCTGGRAM